MNILGVVNGSDVEGVVYVVAMSPPHLLVTLCIVVRREYKCNPSQSRNSRITFSMVAGRLPWHCCPS